MDVVKWLSLQPRTAAGLKQKIRWRVQRLKKRLVLWLLSQINPIVFPNRGDISPEVTLFFLGNEYAHYFSSDPQTSRILTSMLEEFKRQQLSYSKMDLLMLDDFLWRMSKNMEGELIMLDGSISFRRENGEWYSISRFVNSKDLKDG